MAKFVQQSHLIWNHFDDLGLILGIKRKPGETNFQMRKRILDSHKGMVNSSRQGLVNALNRDFGFDVYNVIDKKFFLLDFLPMIDYPITVKVDGATYANQVVEQIPLPDNWIIPSGLTTLTPPTYIGAAASGLATSFILWRNPEGEYSRILEFISVPETGSEIQITYNYRIGDTIYERTDRDFKDLPKEKDEIYDLEGLFTGYKQLGADPTGSVKVFELHDQTFLSDPANGFWTTEGIATAKLEAVVTKIRDAAPIFWDHFIADDTFWDTGAVSFTGIENLPVIFDAQISGYYRTSDNFYLGLKSDFESGIGHGGHLFAARLIDGPLESASGVHVPKTLTPSGAVA